MNTENDASSVSASSASSAPAASVPDLHYKAFISYRHLPLDKEAAEKIQKGIENYTVPREFRELAGGSRLGKVFRDEDELPISSSLSDSITYALDHTEFLIVICTPDLPKSRWCAQEVKYFLETHDRDHVIAVLADGTPDESFSPYLLHEYDHDGNITADLEPLAANIGGPGHTIDKKSFKKEMMRIRAALLGVPFDSLWQRERRRRTVQAAAAMGVVMAGLAVFLGVTLSKNAQIRKQNEQISAQNDQIREQNEEISQQNTSLQQQLSSVLVDKGTSLLGEFDRRGAEQNALAAIETNDPAIYDHRAAGLLAKALGAYSIDLMTGDLVYEQTTDIVDLQVDAESGLVYLADLVGNVSCVDPVSGELLWRETSVYADNFDGAFRTRLTPAPRQGLLLCKNYYNLAALSLKDGSLVWNYTYESANTMFCLSGDGSRIALFDRARYLPGVDPSQTIVTSQDYNYISDLVFLNTEDGSETGRFPLGDDQTMSINFTSSQNYGASFSDSGRLFACGFAIRTVDGNLDDGRYEYYLVDAETAKQVRHGTVGYAPAATDLFYGIAIDEETGSMLAAQYNVRYGGILITNMNGTAMTVDHRVIEQTLRSADGLVNDFRDISLVPMLCSDHLAVIASEDSVYILDIDTGEIRRSFALTGNVEDMIWLDRDKEIMHLIASDGTFATYDLDHEEGWFDSYSQDQLAQNNNAKARILVRPDAAPSDGPEGYLTVPADHPGRLIRVGTQSDPNIRRLEPASDLSYYDTCFCSSPSGKRVFCLTSTRNGDVKQWTLVAYDASTGEEVGRNVFPNSNDFYNIRQIAALDEDTVIGRYLILPLEGEPRVLHGLEDITNRLPSAYDSIRSCRLEDGSLMTVINMNTSALYDDTFDLIAIGDSLLPSALEEENLVRFRTRSVFEISPLGYELGYGEYKTRSESGELTVTNTPAFVLYDSIREKKYIIPDAAPDATSRHASLGTETDVFLCGDDTGCVWLYDIPSGQARLITDSYSRNEIMDVTMVPGDQQAVIFSRTGKLDVLDLSTGEVLYTATFSSLFTYITNYRCDCELDETHDRLYLLVHTASDTTGKLIAVDRTSWTTDCSFEDRTSFGWMRADDRIYFYERGLYSFPAYHLNDLAAWARENGPDAH